MLDCFEPTWDKRWENSFQTAFGAFSMEKVAWIPYTKNIVTLTSDLCQKYGIDASHVGEKFIRMLIVMAKRCLMEEISIQRLCGPKG